MDDAITMEATHEPPEPRELHEYELGNIGDSNACFDGDHGDLPSAARHVCTELLRKYSISEATEGALYQIALDHLPDVERCLNNLFLRVRVNKR